jgi:hypothetical protein
MVLGHNVTHGGTPSVRFRREKCIRDELSPDVCADGGRFNGADGARGRHLRSRP